MIISLNFFIYKLIIIVINSIKFLISTNSKIIFLILRIIYIIIFIIFFIIIFIFFNHFSPFSYNFFTMFSNIISF